MVLYIFWNICAFVVTVGILITIHELGHFIAARAFGVTVQRFSIGFGYIFWKYQDKHNTEYVISAIPLGGYVKMLHKNETLTTENCTLTQPATTFEEQTIWRKMIIIAAGPIFNIIFAFIIYWLIFVIGISTYRPIIADIIPNSIFSQYKIPCNSEIKSINNINTPDWESVRWMLFNTITQQKEKNITLDVAPIHSTDNKKYFIDLTNCDYTINTKDIITAVGIIPMPTVITQPIVSKIEKSSAGMKAGLRVGDEIISINEQTIKTWEEFIEHVKHNPDTILYTTIIRKNKTFKLQIKPDKIIKNNVIEGYIGVFPTYVPTSKEYTVTQKFNPIISIKKSIEKVWKIISLTYNVLYKLIIGDIEFNALGGPIAIAQGAKEATKYGMISYLIFLSLISINLGITNLLPLPILDGGYLLLLIIEKIIGKKVSKQIEKYTYPIGILLLILLMCLAIFNDLSKF
ncbi:sigma E protease regulator RseP [Blochmannia endosymbiont of Polyrhachis (Hedomyrma) turneri]|uniref:sigma E protease regulator RseP n=1 Tax=Blochmannia endosymbiont of Polyrhachis (Hedomyrma) turneri TaxID=1505596 RepID=UPI000AF804AE|nr:sigma E protease regulator RseP [Blochmannia endosymbiont of Polyrhachis (Hedomyrma) turneri]